FHFRCESTSPGGSPTARPSVDPGASAQPDLQDAARHHPRAGAQVEHAPPAGCTIGVCVVVGQTTLMVMPSLATSSAADLAIPMTPHLVALYAASSGMPILPPIEEVTT